LGISRIRIPINECKEYEDMSLDEITYKINGLAGFSR
jgi:hypothetical protein